MGLPETSVLRAIGALSPHLIDSLKPTHNAVNESNPLNLHVHSPSPLSKCGRKKNTTIDQLNNNKENQPCLITFTCLNYSPHIHRRPQPRHNQHPKTTTLTLHKSPKNRSLRDFPALPEVEPVAKALALQRSVVGASGSLRSPARSPPVAGR